MKLNSLVLALFTIAAGLRVSSAADITGIITLNGTPPAEKTNTDILDPKYADTCGKLLTGPVTTQFYVVGKNNGLKDVVVYLTGIKGKSVGGSAAPIVLDQKVCEYAPYIIAVQTGQKILIRNSDPAPIAHNIHAQPKLPGNNEQNKLQSPGDPDIALTFDTPEDFITFACDVHPWMRAYVTVVDHPWFAVTGADGSFKIANVPPGKYTVQALHRKANGGKPVTKDTEVKDGSVTLDFVLDVPK